VIGRAKSVIKEKEVPNLLNKCEIIKDGGIQRYLCQDFDGRYYIGQQKNHFYEVEKKP
jgi:hypothetical protein